MPTYIHTHTESMYTYAYIHTHSYTRNIHTIIPPNSKYPSHDYRYHLSDGRTSSGLTMKLSD